MKIITYIFFIFFSISLAANNIEIKNVTLETQNTVDDYYMISMDISWENSWRTSTYESNWDAAWVFVKFTIKNTQEWDHAWLNYIDGDNDGHTVPTGCTIKTANNSYGTLTRGVGVFIYRSSDGIGDVQYQGIKLRWNYGDNGLEDDDPVEISVNAIEMVYIPQGSFSVGDGSGGEGVLEAGNSGLPFEITSESQLTLGGTNTNNLSNNDAINMWNEDDFNYTTTRTLPAEFPKGYDSYYIMKYEASQGQYAEFLRRITTTQREDRSGPHIALGENQFEILDGDHWATANFPWRAMNYMSWADMAAYLDWAGLRPLSELEYEKACRGPLTPVPNEHAWGSDSWYAPSTLYYTYTNEGTADEMISVGIGVETGNANSAFTYFGSIKPVRCGIFAASAINKTREETGSSYYGVMEMTGNCNELVISIGNSQSRDCIGLHGDGIITSSGNATITLLFDWAFVNAIGIGRKSSETSDRYAANYNYADRENFHGIRGVRSAQ